MEAILTITRPQKAAEEDAIIRECKLESELRRQQKENADLRAENDEYRVRLEREMKLKFARYEREIAADKAANEAHANRMAMAKQIAMTLLASVGIAALVLQMLYLIIAG